VQAKIAADFKVRVSFSPADMSEPAAIHEMIEKTLQTSGRLDILGMPSWRSIFPQHFI
jgi:3-hydroxybutyrate dehydrogenase